MIDGPHFSIRQHFLLLPLLQLYLVLYVTLDVSEGLGQVVPLLETGSLGTGRASLGQTYFDAASDIFLRDTL